VLLADRVREQDVDELGGQAGHGARESARDARREMAEPSTVPGDDPDELVHRQLLRPGQVEATVPRLAPAHVSGRVGRNPPARWTTATASRNAAARRLRVRRLKTDVLVSADGKRVAVLHMNGRTGSAGDDEAHRAIWRLYCAS
jgi:hypothetical protein